MGAQRERDDRARAAHILSRPHAVSNVAHMIDGGCLCSAVRYHVTGSSKHVTHCYCGMCRKQHGAAFATYASIRRESVELRDPANALSAYRSSAKVLRSFCRSCGSSLFWSHDDSPGWIAIAVGTFDGEPDRTPDAHIFVGERPAWVQICDALPQYDKSVPPHEVKSGE